jgi:hypothetical protein
MNNTIENNAREFGLHANQGGWRLGLLVARSVEKGRGASTGSVRNDRYGHDGKVSAQEFGRLSGTSAPRVLRYLKAWEQAADAGHVPHAADLKPDSEPGLDADKLPVWSHFYDASEPKPAARPSNVFNLRDRKTDKEDDTTTSEKPKGRVKLKQTYKPLKGKAAVSHDPAVIQWVRERYDEKWTRDDMVTASVNKTDGWPRPDAELTNGGVSEVRAAIKAIERIEQEQAGEQPEVVRRPPSGKLLRELRARRKAGDTSILIDVRMMTTQLADQLSFIDLPSYDHQSDVVTWELEYIYEALIELQVWMDITTTFVQSHLKDTAVRAKIKHMRENTSGRTEHEIMIANKLADRLERKLDGDMSLMA